MAVVLKLTIQAVCNRCVIEHFGVVFGYRFSLFLSPTLENTRSAVRLTWTAPGLLITALYKHLVMVWTVWPPGRDWGENQRFSLLYLMVGV